MSEFANANIPVDVIIFGGGTSGLWLLDELTRRGWRSVLLEAHALGAGQTVHAQGIIHGGLKYTLRGGMTDSAKAIREMPQIWRECLAGQREPNLARVAVRAPWCALWRTGALRSRLGMVGARAGLRVAPQRLDAIDRPSVLASCPGDVLRLDEQVIEPRSFVEVLAARHHDRILKIDADAGMQITQRHTGGVTVLLANPDRQGETMTLEATTAVLTAGAGNETLRGMLRLPAGRTQRRPLHTAVVRGRLPVLNGHCVDGKATRLTVTTQPAGHENIWQLGGMIAEKGINSTTQQLVRHARAEAEACLPGIDLTGMRWSSYFSVRAEPLTESGKRPDHALAMREGDVITAWPAKLALAPDLAERIITMLPAPNHTGDSKGHSKSSSDIANDDTAKWSHWPRPSVANYPWDEPETPWCDDV